MHNEAKPIFYFGYLGGRKVLYSMHVGGRYTFLTFEHGDRQKFSSLPNVIGCIARDWATWLGV